MTWFNFLQKPIVLNCYTKRTDVFNFAPVSKSSDFIPNWWKDIPKTINPEDKFYARGTMKGCAGFTDLYNTGFIIPMWSDFAIELGEIGNPHYRFQYSDHCSQADEHSTQQRGSAYPATHYQHLKLISPWLFRCDEDIDFLFTEPSWNIDTPEKIQIMTGILNFKYETQSNVNMLFIKQPEVSRYFINFGQPIAHIIPLTERKVILKTHLVDDETYSRINGIGKQLKFVGNYRMVKQTVKNNKCPFHITPEK
jgi:hypothetical protein